ncbi:SMP-30/gluconolactonase/LRE family protein [Streptomyces sp. NPDC056296]|uniref:SMP-30/gluconolactonase/LRE family protein n=1 Tax=Streptomyces sp. NPDC056296 TaxID=3345775 RepID=UPI0035D62ADF
MADAAQSFELVTLIDGLRFTESLRWHEGHLYFADVHNGHVFRLGRSGEKELVLDLGEAPGGLGWMPDGSLLLVAQDSRRLMRYARGSLTLHADLSDTGDCALNDMWVDASGRAYVGDMGFDIHAFNRLFAAGKPEALELVRPAHVHLVLPDGTVETATDEPVLFANGISVTDAGEVVVAESFGMRLTAFEQRADGRFGASRTVLELGFAPDGLSQAPGQGTWVADPSGNRAILVGPDGAVLREIPTEHKCLDIAVGGDAGQYLYLATSPTTDPADTLAAPSARIVRASLH